MLMLSDTTPTDTTLAPAIQQIEVKTVTFWHMVVFGAITGFAMALGTMLFTKGARKLGVEPELHGTRRMR
jgi:hypothetical protein